MPSKEPLEVDELVRRIVVKVGLGFNLPTPKPVLFGLRGLQNEENVVAASRHLTPICRGNGDRWARTFEPPISWHATRMSSALFFAVSLGL